MFKGGSATDDIKEMKAATADDRIRFVIQTGGTTFWHNGDMDEDLNQRFVIEGGKLIKVSEEDRVSMGKSSTLADFLKWGVKNFAAEKMGVVLWDHGGGSIEGVCWDEYDEDCLTLREIDAALLSVYKTMTDKFEFVGMDRLPDGNRGNGQHRGFLRQIYVRLRGDGARRRMGLH